ncbi:MAG: hypothetical protein ACP5FK_10550 [bacterium]
MKFSLIFSFISITIILKIFPAYSQNSIIPGNIRIDATFQHISLLWWISGDDNHNSSLSLEYRPGTGGNWQPGAITVRACPDFMVNGSPLGMNYHAGSIMFLNENTEYDIRLTLTDPDGGGEVRTITANTVQEQQASPTGTHRYVIPGNGGGSGTVNDPFKGLQEAADHASPGDIFHVSAGAYSSFTLTTSGDPGSPIVFMGSSTDTSFIDGNGTSSGIITIGNYSDSCGYIILEGFVIQNGTWGIDAQNTHNILVKRNIFRDIGWGYYNRRENGWEHNQVITDNIFTGIVSWPGSGIPPERCIDIRGNNNIICYNEISYFADGISTDGNPYGVSYSLDIYYNDISYCVDDPLEVDGTVANTRVWRNRVCNGRMGISLAPILGGPCYIFRNEFFNTDYSTYKMNRQPSGLVIIHNTSVKLNQGTTSDADWQNTYFRNNVLLSTEYVFEEYDLVSTSLMDDWDYDALGSTRAGTSAEPWFKWNNIRYDDLSALQSGAGIELNGLAIGFNDLVDANLPTSYGNGVVPGSYNLSLTFNSNSINSGEILENINDPFVFDGNPDCGAFEYGQPLPIYGPRFGLIGVEEGALPVLNNYQLTVNPNPFSTICHITIQSLPEMDNIDFSLHIIDISGRIVTILDPEVGQNNHSLDLNYLWKPDQEIPSGFYFIQIKGEPTNYKLVLIR